MLYIFDFLEWFITVCDKFCDVETNVIFIMQFFSLLLLSEMGIVYVVSNIAVTILAYLCALWFLMPI